VQSLRSHGQLDAAMKNLSVALRSHARPFCGRGEASGADVVLTGRKGPFLHAAPPGKLHQHPALPEPAGTQHEG